MEIEKTFIEGLLIVKPKVFSDNRGYFFESYNKVEFERLGIRTDFVQDNESCSSKGVVRGLHFQAPPFAQAKLIRVIKGSVLDFAVDIRRGSPTYGKHVSVRLDDKQKNMFFIPEGFAHGFVTLEDNTIFSYKCTALYNKESEGGLLWSDPNLNIDWQIENPILSDKDKLWQDFESFISPFDYDKCL